MTVARAAVSITAIKTAFEMCLEHWLSIDLSDPNCPKQQIRRNLREAARLCLADGEVMLGYSIVLLDGMRTFGNHPAALSALLSLQVTFNSNPEASGRNALVDEHGNPMPGDSAGIDAIASAIGYVVKRVEGAASKPSPMAPKIDNA